MSNFAVRSGCQLRAVPCKCSWPLHRVWAEAVGGRRCASLGAGNSLSDKPVTNADQAAQSLAAMRPVIRSNVSICVMPITALAGAVPHSGWAVGASVRDLTTRWHGKEQRVAVPNLIQLRRRLAAHLGVVVVLPASWRGLVGPIAARHATATRARKCDHVCRPGLLPLRALQRHSRDCIG